MVAFWNRAGSRPYWMGGVDEGYASSKSDSVQFGFLIAFVSRYLLCGVVVSCRYEGKRSWHMQHRWNCYL